MPGGYEPLLVVRGGRDAGARADPHKRSAEGSTRASAALVTRGEGAHLAEPPGTPERPRARSATAGAKRPCRLGVLPRLRGSGGCGGTGAAGRVRGRAGAAAAWGADAEAGRSSRPGAADAARGRSGTDEKDAPPRGWGVPFNPRGAVRAGFHTRRRERREAGGSVRVVTERDRTTGGPSVAGRARSVSRRPVRDGDSSEAAGRRRRALRPSQSRSATGRWEPAWRRVAVGGGGRPASALKPGASRVVKGCDTRRFAFR